MIFLHLVCLCLSFAFKLIASQSEIQSLDAEWTSNTTIELRWDNVQYEIVLHPVDRRGSKKCQFNGKIKDDSKSDVAVSGCSDSEKTFISINSKLVGGLVDGMIVSGSDPRRRKRSIFSSMDQSAEINQEEDCVDPKAPLPQRENRGFRSSNNVPLPDSIDLVSTLWYDKSLLNQFDGNHDSAKEWVYQVIETTKTLFQHDTLDTKVNLIITEPLNYFDKIINANGPHKDWLGEENGNPGANKSMINSYIVSCTGLVPCYLGITNRKSACLTSGEAININNNDGTKDVLATAATLAHELGHMIGMEHDFHQKHGGTGRSQTSNNPCKQFEGIMGYTTYPQRWSECSNKDFKEWFTSYGVCIEETAEIETTIDLSTTTDYFTTTDLNLDSSLCEFGKTITSDLQLQNELVNWLESWEQCKEECKYEMGCEYFQWKSDADGSNACKLFSIKYDDKPDWFVTGHKSCLLESPDYDEMKECMTSVKPKGLAEMMNSTRPSSFEECQNECKNYPFCDFFTWKEGASEEWNKCWFWNVEYQEGVDGDYVAGYKDCVSETDTTTTRETIVDIPCMEEKYPANADFIGGQIKEVEYLIGCQSLCEEEPKCEYFKWRKEETLERTICQLYEAPKNGEEIIYKPIPKRPERFISGHKFCDYCNMCEKCHYTEECGWDTPGTFA